MNSDLSAPETAYLAILLEESALLHNHLCPRQVLGVRIGLAGLRELGFIDDAYRPRYRNENKRLLTIMETDGCGLDGVAVSTGCAVGKRTLRVVDYGKVAATFVDTHKGRAIRAAPSSTARKLAITAEPDAESPWHAYLAAYQSIPDASLITVKDVILTRSISDILSKPDAKVVCHICGEEIINEREVVHQRQTLCRSCAGDRYYEES